MGNQERAGKGIKENGMSVATAIVKMLESKIKELRDENNKLQTENAKLKELVKEAEYYVKGTVLGNRIEQALKGK